LVIDQRPGITPDQLKQLLRNGADRVPSASSACQGAGELNLGNVASAPTPAASQNFTASTGTGSLEASRGSANLVANGVVLRGERDVTGRTWDGTAWSGQARQRRAWANNWAASSGDWNGVSWSSGRWEGVSWSGVSWSGVSWSGVSWSGVSWSGVSWSDFTWAGTWG
jgi:serine protease AprX